MNDSVLYDAKAALFAAAYIQRFRAYRDYGLISSLALLNSSRDTSRYAACDQIRNLYCLLFDKEREMIISSFDGLSYSRGDVYGLNSAATLSKTGLSAQNQSGTTSDQDAIERAFETASIGASEFVAADMKARILEADLNSQTYVERALILRFQSAQALSKSSVNEAIKAQNLILASRGEPPITPAEERALESRAHAIVKQRIAFLDAFTKAADAKFVKIRI